MIVIEIDTEKANDELAMEMAKGIVHHPDVTRATVYDDGEGNIHEDELFSLHFKRFVGVVVKD